MTEWEIRIILCGTSISLKAETTLENSIPDSPMISSASYARELESSKFIAFGCKTKGMTGIIVSLEINL